MGELHQGRPKGSKNARKAVRDRCLAICDDPNAGVSDQLHACDLLLMIMGLGSRTSGGNKSKINRKLERTTEQLREAKNAAKRQVLDASVDAKSVSRKRLDELMNGCPTPVNTCSTPVESD